MMKKKSRSGLTMLEVVIASAILIAVVVMTFMLLIAASKEEASQQTLVHLDNQILQVLNRIGEDIRNSGGAYSMLDGGGADTILQPTDALYIASAGSTVTQCRYSLSFGINTGFVITGKTGVAQFGTTTVRYYWKPAYLETPDNGLDDNRDGLIDEGDVVREETTGGVTTTSAVCKNVSLRGLAFQNPSTAGGNPKTINIFMQLMAKDTKNNKVFTRKASLSAGPRT